MKRQIQGNKATFLLITLDHFWLENQIQWEKLSRKNTHIYIFYFWFKSKRVWTSLDEFGRKKPKVQKLRKINTNNYFIVVFQYILCKHAQKRSFMTNLMKRQIHTNESTFLFIILDLFWLQNQIQWKKLSGKTYSYYYIYVWFKNKRVRTSSDEFGRNLTKKLFLRKSLRIFF